MGRSLEAAAEDELIAVLDAERARLVRLCAALTGDADAAEDVAQETLAEAWRQRHKLQALSGAAPWLTAIARNMCLRWRRTQWRAGRADPLLPDTEPESAAAVADPFDLEVELERAELATLLDRALALLPPETRAVLVAKYVAESSLAAIAARLGINEGAVAVRLHRGKAAFRRVLANELRADAAPYGLVDGAGGWQTTAIWCPLCGSERLEAQIQRAAGMAMARCPGCANHERGGICTTLQPELLAGVQGFKPILSRQLTWLHRYYRDALAGRPGPCPWCGGPIAISLGWVDPPMRRGPELRGMRLGCMACGATEANSLRYMVLDLPETQRFWRASGRMRVLPDQEMIFAGRAAVLTRFQSLTSADRLDVVSAVDTFAVLSVEGVPQS